MSCTLDLLYQNVLLFKTRLYGLDASVYLCTVLLMVLSISLLVQATVSFAGLVCQTPNHFQ